MNQSGKIIFADQLRVLAFLSVVATHWVGVFWVHPDTISFLGKVRISRSFLPKLTR